MKKQSEKSRVQQKVKPKISYPDRPLPVAPQSAPLAPADPVVCSDELRAICQVVPFDGHVVVGSDEDAEAARTLLDSLGKHDIRIGRHKHRRSTWSR